MKLPRWLVIAMLTFSVLAVLSAGGWWWWVTWPERTAYKFLSLMREGKWEQAEAMIGTDHNGLLVGGGDWIGIIENSLINDEFSESAKSLLGSTQLEADGPSSLADIMMGRRNFRVLQGGSPWGPAVQVQYGKVMGE